MKNSNIQWIGEIPDDWEVYTIKHLFKIGRGRVISELELVDDGKYPVYSSQTQNDGCMGYINTYDFDLQQLTWTTDGVYAGTVFIRSGKHNCTNVCGTLQLKDPNNNLLFIKYALEFIAVYHRRKDINGGKIMNNEMAQIKIPLPPLPIQTSIATYLDSKCSEIDSLIADINKQIETLNELKKSTITEVVTRGLNKNVKLKDSGIQWCSKVPSHWVIKPFKYILQERSENNYPIVTNERLSLSIGLGVTLYSEKTTNLDRFKDDVSQYKIAHQGDLVMNSMNVIVGAVGTSNYYGCVSPAYYTFYDTEDDHVTAKFCEYVFLTPPMRKVLYSLGKGIMAIDRGDGRVNTCRLKVSKYDLGKIKIAVPPIEEQRSIAKYLDKLENDTNSIISEKQNQISTLEAYKKSLIYEYVTGKKQLDI